MLPGCFGVTVTVTAAVAGGLVAPVAVAVYVVVVPGVTVCVPPVLASGYDEPSVPVMTTVVALVATTVNVDEVPAVIVVGLALIVTVGAVDAFTVTVVLAVAVPPAPVTVIV